LRPYRDIDFIFPDGLDELPEPTTCHKIQAKIRFPGEEPRQQSLSDWRVESLANKDDVRYIGFWTSLKKDLESYWRRRNGIVTDQATRLLMMIGELGIHLFCDERNVTHAAIPIEGGGHYCVAVDDSQFADYIAHRFYLIDGRAPGSAALSDCLRTVRGMTRYEGEKRTLVLRVGEYEGAFYYDLCDDKGRAVRVTPDNWEICQAPIIFRRFPHMIAQVEPKRDPEGCLDKFVKMWHLVNPDYEDMLKVMMGCLLVPGIPKELLGLHGPPGSAKSMLTYALKIMIDPSTIIKQKLPFKEEELKRVLSKHYLCCFDNVRDMKDWQSDIIAVAVTGGTTTSRALYTNDDDFSRELKTAVIMNGVNLETRESDLLDRALTLETKSIPKELRRDESEIYAEIERKKPGILAELMDYLSKAMRVKDTIDVKDKPRMADWYVWALCFAEVMGIGQARFREIFSAFQERQNAYAIENNLVGMVVMSYADTFEGDPYIAGTPTEIMEKLSHHATEEMKINTNVKNWPRTTPEFSRELNKIVKNLNASGIWIIDCKYRDIRGKNIIKHYDRHYVNDARIKIITKDREPFKQVQNTRLDDPEIWQKCSQSSNQNSKTGETGEFA